MKYSNTGKKYGSIRKQVEQQLVRKVEITVNPKKIAAVFDVFYTLINFYISIKVLRKILEDRKENKCND